MPNVYYAPEEFGLSVVATMEWSYFPYEFDTTVVWKDAEGNLFMASDSGCSCPVPFEGVEPEPVSKGEIIGRVTTRYNAECRDPQNPDLLKEFVDFKSTIHKQH